MYNERDGYCYCGCGEKTPNAKETNSRTGAVKGQPTKYIPGHNPRGAMHGGWKGGESLCGDGYVLVTVSGFGSVKRCRLVAEKAIGKKLPLGAMVYHHNGNRSDDSNSNLVVCQDEEYHRIIHARARAFYACGHAGWRLCRHCKKWDHPSNLTTTHKYTHYHKSCQANFSRERRKLRRLKNLPALLVEVAA